MEAHTLIPHEHLPLFRVDVNAIAYSVRVMDGEALLCREEGEIMQIVATFETPDDALALVAFVRGFCSQLTGQPKKGGAERLVRSTRRRRATR